MPPLGSAVASPTKSAKASKKSVKRPRTKEVDKTMAAQTQAKRRGRQGRLSVLPTLPMDLLYEIFAHLGPADLLSLARTTKGFRNILMSRQSAFIWRAVLDAASQETGHPPRPDDMDEPAWANLIYGGAKCSLCGAKTAKSIWWTYRVRLCKGCQNTNLFPICTLDRPDAMDPTLNWCEVIPSEAGRFLGKGGTNREDESHPILRQDMEAYVDELDALLDSSEGNFYALRAQMDKERKAKMLKRYEHVNACHASESSRSISRTIEIRNLKETRFEQIRSRLLEMGYDTVDIDSNEFKHHAEVRVAKLVTDKIWTRLGPIVSSVADGIRDRRFAYQRLGRMEKCKGIIEEEYNSTIMRAIPWSMVSFIPPVHRLWAHPELEDVQKVLEDDDVNSSEEGRLSLRQALLSSIPAVQQRLVSAAERLRNALPPSWSTTESTAPRPALSHQFANTNYELDLTPLVSLDRAAFVFRCQDHSPRGLFMRPIHFGLDGMAHGCALRQEIPLELKDGLRSLVIQILELLALDPTTATPLDVDRLAPVLVCTHGRTCDPGDGTGGVAFPNWRDAVAHGDTRRTLPDHQVDPPIFRLASDLETRYTRAMVTERDNVHAIHRKDTVGCCHCTEHLAFRLYFSRYVGPIQSWMTLREAQDHLLTSHNIHNGVEGQDYYYDRKSPAARFEPNIYEKSASIVVSGGRYYNPGSVRLPEVTAVQLEAQVLAKEAALAPIPQ